MNCASGTLYCASGMSTTHPWFDTKYCNYLLGAEGIINTIVQFLFLEGWKSPFSKFIDWVRSGKAAGCFELILTKANSRKVTTIARKRYTDFFSLLFNILNSKLKDYVCVHSTNLMELRERWHINTVFKT